MLFEVTATLLAIYLKASESSSCSIESDDIIYSEPSAEYTGSDNFVPPKDMNGHDVFLAKNDLMKSNLYIDDKVKALYKLAAANPCSLLLDVTTSAVTAAGNVHQKAKKALKLCPNVIAVVVTGGHVTVYSKDAASLHKQSYTSRTRMADGSKLAFSKVLNELDTKQVAAGGKLTQPVFVFGYSQLQAQTHHSRATTLPISALVVACH